MLKSALHRPVWLTAAATTVLLLVALALLMGTAWRSLQRLQPVERHLAQLVRLQTTGLRIQELLVEHLKIDKPFPRRELKALGEEIAAIEAMQAHLHADTPASLRHAHRVLLEPGRDPRSALIDGMTHIRRILTLETRAHGELVSQVRQAAQLELELAAATMIVLPVLGVIVLLLIRRRVLLPLMDLGHLMSRLAERDYRAAPLNDIDPTLRPLLENYNRMVNRLAELEQEHRVRQQTLESQVRAATRTLLEQQRSLADNERLAVVGELSAQIAHELRNPMAGIQMALTNLSADTHEQDHIERLRLVIDEIARMNTLLNQLLNHARQRPEPAQDVHLARAVDDLLKLVRYQLPEQVRLHTEIPADLHCLLPRGAFHQALLNLILNAGNALGDQAGTIGLRMQREDSTLNLEVCDDGPGFPQELLQAGIRTFASDREGGTGLGLAVTRRFVRECGGTLELRNADPNGACVAITLPCRESHV